MSIFAKAKKARENKKGFTLVELIVVLVILAILAAMLVPALLGWIDEARNKQFVLQARNVYMATQAVVDEAYAVGKVDKLKPAAEATPGEVVLKDGTTGGTDGVPVNGAVSRIKKIADAEFESITIKKLNARTNGAGEITGIKIVGLVVNGKKADAELADGEWKIDPKS